MKRNYYAAKNKYMLFLVSVYIVYECVCFMVILYVIF